jgi:hypothetical protein
MSRTEHLTDEELAVYVDGWRTHKMDTIPADLLDHVKQCFECREAVIEVSAAVPDDLFWGNSRGSTEKKLAGQFSPGIFRIAAGIVLVLGIGALVYVVSTHWNTTEPEVKRPLVVEDTSSLLRGPIADNGNTSSGAHDPFARMPMYDRLAHETFRSSSASAMQPENGDTVSLNQKFTWDGGNSKEPFRLTILDNSGRERIQARLLSSTYQLKPGLSEGRYYWKVEQEGSLLFVGEFLIAKKGSTTSQ